MTHKLYLAKICCSCSQYCKTKKVTAIRGLRNRTLSCTDIIVVGENAEAKELSVMCKTLLDAIENFNNTRHWWERKIKIDNVL